MLDASIDSNASGKQRGSRSGACQKIGHKNKYKGTGKAAEDITPVRRRFPKTVTIIQELVTRERIESDKDRS
jgi:hypothetical protein